MALKAGVEFFFETEVTDIKVANGKVTHVATNGTTLVQAALLTLQAQPGGTLPFWWVPIYPFTRTHTRPALPSLLNGLCCP